MGLKQKAVKMNQKIKDVIDAMSLRQLIERWRNAPIGDPMFVGEAGDYYRKVLDDKRRQASHEEQVRISKDIGWEGST
jgi:hypothetical protein